MKIKTFEALTPAEAMFLARQEMGEDALILHVGPAGNVSSHGERPSLFQVTVGVDDPPLTVATPAPVRNRSTGSSTKVDPARFTPLIASRQQMMQPQSRSLSPSAPATPSMISATIPANDGGASPLAASRRLWRRGKQQARLVAAHTLATPTATSTGYAAADNDIENLDEAADKDNQHRVNDEDASAGIHSMIEEPATAPWDGLLATMLDMQQSIRSLELAGRQGALTRAFPLIQELDQHLRRQEVAPDLIDDLLHTLEGRLGRPQFEDETAIVAALRAELFDRARSCVPAIEHPGQDGNAATDGLQMPTIYVVAGLSGSGKSTVLSKLATRLTLGQTGQPRRVGIVSIDHAQVGTTAGLRTLAEILGLPFTMACNPIDLRQVIAGWLPSTTGKTTVLARQEVDVILVDTPGYRPEPMRLGEFRTFLQVLPPYSLYLVASGTSKYSDVSALAAALIPAEQPISGSSMRQNKNPAAKVPAHGMIVTKLDETTTYGPLLSLACTTGLALGYLSQGNDVLTGMTPAASHMLIDLVVPPSLSLQPQATRRHRSGSQRAEGQSVVANASSDLIAEPPIAVEPDPVSDMPSDTPQSLPQKRVRQRRLTRVSA